MRLTLVTNIPTPYRGPLYTKLDRLLRARGGALSIVFGARFDGRVQWATPESPPEGPPSLFLNDRPLRVRGRSLYVNPRVVRALAATSPDAVVVGGFGPWIYPASLWCRVNRIPYLLWSGETMHTVAGGRAQTLRRVPLLRRAAGCLAYGPDARAYLEAVGVSPGRITVVGNGIDIDVFAKRVDEARRQRSLHRRELGLVGPTVLSVGGKGLDQALPAIDLLGGEAQILVVGAREQQSGARLVDIGRRPPGEMPMLYAAAHCLVHTPRADLWPHAINEALSGGLPVVASTRTGVPDAALTGPGCAVVERDPAAIAAALESALGVANVADDALREAVRAPLRPWDVCRMAERVVAAAEQALARN